MHRERLRELRPLVERVERIFEVRHPDAEFVELVLERVDQLLQLVEVGLRRPGVGRGFSFSCSLAITRATTTAIS